MKKIARGVSDFKRFITENYYYVDKTLLIKDIIEDASQVILIPRPRRFGKTLNMTMLKYFFEETDLEHHSLFENLKVYNYKDIMKLQGKYPVIYITFKDIKHSTWEKCKESLAILISNLFKDFKETIYDCCNEEEKKYFNKILNKNGSLAELEVSFKTLTELLYKKTGKKSIVLIDEYDIPIQEAYLQRYYSEFMEFNRNLLSGVLKDNIYLEKAVLTGILRVAKESIFSGLNNVTIYNLLSTYYSKYFGFMEDEVEEILCYYNISEKLEEVKSWYNGYNFGGITIYNPWSVLNYVQDNNLGFRAYWANTSSNDLIRDILASGSSSVKTELESLINGEKLVKVIDENIVMNEITKSTENLWSFLLFSGYLRAIDTELIEARLCCTLDIPNREVKYIYEEIISKWFKEKVDNDKFLLMLKSLVCGDMETFEMIFIDIVEKTLSYFDVTGEGENFYHAFVLGMLVALDKTHLVKSNRESGYGRYDVMIIPKDKNALGIIMELKRVNKRRKETLVDAVDAALKQIEDKKYNVEMLGLGINNILEVGIAFDGKEVLMKERGKTSE